MTMNGEVIKEKLSKSKPYIWVFCCFCVAFLCFIFLVDWLVLPALVQDKPSIKMPDIVGKSISDAEKLLDKAGLSSRKINEQNSDAVPAGTVISQTPPKDIMVKGDRTVYITVSKGENATDVPNMVGMPSRQARILAMNKGFTIGDIDYQNSDLFGNDTVVRQSKKYGTKLAPGSPINITISSGPELQVSVPNLVGKPLEEVKSILAESKLVLGTINTIKNETYVSNTVITQTPENGSMVKQNSVVNITITK